jgi:hypothetical protein
MSVSRFTWRISRSSLVKLSRVMALLNRSSEACMKAITGLVKLEFTPLPFWARRSLVLTVSLILHTRQPPATFNGTVLTMLDGLLGRLDQDRVVVGRSKELLEQHR